MRVTVIAREFKNADLDDCIHLFRETVHSINARDYSLSQLNAWAPEYTNKEDWLKLLADNITYVALYQDKIVGFGCMTTAGYFDMLYVHKNFQCKGIAVAITKKILARANALGIKKIWAEVSITAKSFCENFGMHVCKEQVKELRGEKFINYLMEGELSSIKIK